MSDGELVEENEGKKEWANDYRELKKEAQANDNKDIFKLLSFTKTTTLKKEIQAMATTEENHIIDRLYEKEELDKFRAMLKKDLKSLKDHLNNLTKNPSQISKIGPLTENIEKKVTTFQEKKMINFDKLLEEEAILTAEIDAVVDRLDEYEIPVEPKEVPTFTKTNSFIIKTLKRPIVSATQKEKIEIDEEGETFYEYTNNDSLNESEQRMNHLKEEISEIDKQLGTLGGQNLGWNREDHQMFLKLKTKHGGYTEGKEFMEEILLEVPKKEYEISEHAERYEMFTELNERKKFLVDEYKALKSVVMQTLTEAQKERELEQTRKREVKPLYNEEERLKVKEDIKKWREHKTKTFFTEKENEEINNRSKKLEKTYQHEARRAFISKQVEDYKIAKVIEKQFMKEQEELKKTTNRRIFTKEEIQHIKEKEDILLKNRQEKISLAKKKAEEKSMRNQKILENAPSMFTNVNSRLDEQTIAQQGKMREKFDPRRNLPKIADSFGGNFVRTTGKALIGYRPINNL